MKMLTQQLLKRAFRWLRWESAGAVSSLYQKTADTTVIFRQFENLLQTGHWAASSGSKQATTASARSSSPARGVRPRVPGAEFCLTSRHTSLITRWYFLASRKP